MQTGWQIHENGAFDAEVGPLRLTGAYPAMDGEPVRASGVKVKPDADGGRIVYGLREGELELRLGRDADGLTLAATLRGTERAPWSVQPLAGATVEGADRLYRQGLGFSGPSGWERLDEQAKNGHWAFESYLVTGFAAAAGGALAVGALEHGDYLQRCRVWNRQDRRGLINRHLEQEHVYFEAGFSTEGVPTDGGELRLPALHLTAGAEPFPAFRRVAERIGEASKARRVFGTTYHWCSWYTRGPHFTRQDLDVLLEGLDRLSPRVPLQAIQLDDGYCRWQGDWLEPNHRWPGGMEATFETIAARGYKPGIWVAPFMVSNRSRLYREHPEWIIRTHDGRPHAEMKGGGSKEPDEERYALDASHPEVVDYIAHVFRTLRQQGATFFKTDFMDWGLKDTTRVARHNPDETSVQSFVKVLRAIREAIGEESYWLACISPFAPFIGFADGMRTANDTWPRWSAGGMGNMLDESLSDQYFNHIWWQNDPDVTHVREWPSELNEGETYALAYWNGVLGGSVNTSDILPEVPEERLKLWRFLQPQEEPWTAAVPYWSQKSALRVAVRRYEALDAWAVVALNPERREVTRRLPLHELIGQDRVAAYRWWPGGHQALGEVDALLPELEGHGAELYYLSAAGEAPPRDLTLGGARAAF